MFGHKSLPSITYSYDVDPPTIGADDVRRQLREANRYRNKLVEIEHHRREAITAAQAEHCAELADVNAAIATAQAEVETLVESAKQQNQKARKKTDTSAHKSAIKSIKTERIKPLREQQKAIKLRIREDAELKARYKAIDLEHTELDKGAYAAATIYWGTKVAIGGGFQVERKKPIPPKFHGYRGEGRLAVQLQDGPLAKTLLACCDTRVRVDSSSGNINLRIGTTPENSPLWCEVKLCAPDDVASRHWESRPLIDDASVKWVYLTVRKCGPHEKWQVHFVLSRAGGFFDQESATEGMVAVNLGWRMTDDGLRVATWVGDDGREGELVIPGRDAGVDGGRDIVGQHAGRWAKADSLQAIRDRNFNAAHEAFMTWLSAARLRLPMPEWFREATAKAGLWQAPGRLAALAIRWGRDRFAGDSKAFEAVEAWRKQDKHLWTWRMNQKRKAIAYRMNLYRSFAKMLRHQYAAVVIPDVNWSKLYKTPEPTADAEFVPTTYRAVASPGLLQRYLTEKSRFVQFVDAQYITQTCHACEKIDAFDGSAIAHTCRHCGATWDQDRNAARNALRLAASGPVTAEVP